MRRSIEHYFELINKQKYVDKAVDKDSMFNLNGLFIDYGYETLENWLLAFEGAAKHSFRNWQVIKLLCSCRKYGYDFAKQVAIELKYDDSPAAFEEVVETLKIKSERA